MAIEAGASIPRAHRLGHQRIISALRLLYHDPPDGARKSKAVFTRARPRELCSRALAKGIKSPWIPVNCFGGGFLPRCYFPQRRSPAYPFFRKEKIHSCVQGGKYDASTLYQRSRAHARWGVQTRISYRGAFFFTKKAYCGNQTVCVAEVRKSVQTQPPLFPPLRSPSNNGNPFPMRRQRRISEFGEAEFLSAL